jgi:lipoyl(octanoyl) transferase
LIVRQLPFWIADGPLQMAADEIALNTAVEGTASLRLYVWQEPTVSLGYFQPHFIIPHELSRLPYVRRSTGGLTLVHHHEITYALALPANQARQPVARWLEQIHRVIATVLTDLGVRTQVTAEGVPTFEETCLCFHHITRGDLTIGPAKVVGSAQRRQRGALLQHGAILLDTSPHTPTLPGIGPLTGTEITAEDLRDRLPAVLAQVLGWELAAGDWSEQEQQHILRLAEEKYRSPQWNDRR